MSEQQERTTEADQATDLPEHVSAELTTTDAETPSTAPDDAPEQVDAPAEDRVFGMPRTCFHGGAIGIALGYMSSGVIGLIVGKAPSPMTFAIVFAVIGYLFAKRRYNQKKAETHAK